MRTVFKAGRKRVIKIICQFRHVYLCFFLRALLSDSWMVRKRYRYFSNSQTIRCVFTFHLFSWKLFFAFKLIQNFLNNKTCVDMFSWMSVGEWDKKKHNSSLDVLLCAMDTSYICYICRGSNLAKKTSILYIKIAAVIVSLWYMRI